MKRLIFNLSNAFTLTVSILFLSQICLAENSNDLTPMASDLLHDNFRVREHVSISLDGSDAASGIFRNSQFTNELVYLSPQKWRVRRDLPLKENTFEFLMTDKGVRLMNPFNHGTEPSFSVDAKTYLEVLVSPVRFAQAWSLADGSTTLPDLLKHLKKGPLQNVEGDKIELEEKSDGSLNLKLSGKILQDSKTKVNIESVWQLSERNKVTEGELLSSLLRSL
ncbi:MAG: hypothetical protein JWQ35_2199 [Bacteriovoracaceae bacterium]|nr:hypothetical protein [Bacteriovoracaceae bacterium]